MSVMYITVIIEDQKNGTGKNEGLIEMKWARFIINL